MAGKSQHGEKAGRATAVVMDWNDAIDRLRAHGIEAQIEAYGFSASLREPDVRVITVRCGLDHIQFGEEDGSISISVSDGCPPLRWFFFAQDDLAGAVELLVAAARRVNNRESSTWMGAFDALGAVKPGE